MSEKIIIEIRNGVGWVTLNAPDQLNALDLEMIRTLTQTLDCWRDDERVQCVVMQGRGRAFCAGGNLKEIYKAWQQGRLEELREPFFSEEYALNHRIYHFPKPYISIWDGIVMGGGLGISIYGSHRVVTERAKCAMPETGIGYFPDVGACYFLQKCPGQIGLYLGLTGLTITFSDILYTGLGTHYVPCQAIPDFLSSIEDCGIDKALTQFDGGQDENASLIDQQKEIDEIFQMDDFDSIVNRLKTSQSLFAQQTRAVLESRRLQSLRETFSLFKKTTNLPFDQALHLDLKLSRKMSDDPAFIEGIRATVIDKDYNPKW